MLGAGQSKRDFARQHADFHPEPQTRAMKENMLVTEALISIWEFPKIGDPNMVP